MSGKPSYKRRKPTLTDNPERLKKAFLYWRANPVEAAKDWFDFTPEDYQGDMLNALFVDRKERIAAKSAHGVGKTAFLAITGHLFLNFFEQSRLVATAPTMAQLHDQLWPEYAKWHMNMPATLADQWDISGSHIRHKGFPKTWFGVARTSNKPANLQGFHGSHILIEVDEGSGVPDDVFETIEGALSEAGEAGKFAGLLVQGNPNFNAGEFNRAFLKNRDLYERFTISGDPQIFEFVKGQEKDHGRVYVSKRVTEKYRATMASKYGTDGAIYDVRVRGVFPRQEDAAVIPLQWAQWATMVPLPNFDAVADPVDIVCDVGRGGSAETVVGMFRNGHQLYPLRTKAKTSTEQAADMVVEAYHYVMGLGLRVGRIIVDEPGVGGGVIDGLVRRGYAVTPYHGGESLKEDRDGADDVRMFANRRARDWWYVRRLFEQRQRHIDEKDETLVAQLASVQYKYNVKDKIQVEAKEDLKSRLGEDAHLDRADVIVMAMAPWYSFKSSNTAVQEMDVEAPEQERPTTEFRREMELDDTRLRDF
jgi:phage terminase large subunit